MRKILVPIVLMTAVLLAGTAAAATPNVDAREANQRARIDQGVASGALTRREAAGLRAQQAHIRRDERAAKADGVVTRGERRRLQHELDHASANIDVQKHDAQERR
ncbi:MAG: hypothetical protein BGP24_22765 [Lysobacterales bacterium 69-70]|nr:hypothetical protein [Xanthomonadaceae bacterium]ODU34213.1 MAG: hypothetical protein ABS97_08945 [Xanthomonadaceae bacterium SCN 69-320]ODV18528.1 MAG: hypothetical protein ABT27_13500 [Xanthomonadaceae bacterium SCN 69-25]OJY96121.1 MAG: hypothetical protein BGP24_22765 [Xanthomonadales bacterium 69-70]